MTVYVDELKLWLPNQRRPFHDGSCHLTADTLDELHDFAQRIRKDRATRGRGLLETPGPTMHVRPSYPVQAQSGPLLGRVGQLAYWFDGETLRLAILGARQR